MNTPARLLAAALLTLTIKATAADIPVATFAQLPDMHSIALSPDGSAIAFLRPVGDVHHLFVQVLDGETPPRSLPPSDGMRFGWVDWANDERVVFTMEIMDERQTTETLETRLLSMTRDGKDLRPIVLPNTRTGRTGSRLAKETQPSPQIQDNVVAWLPADRDHILVAVDEDFDARHEVRRIDVNSGAYDNVVGNTEGIQSWLVDQAGNVRFGWGFRIDRYQSVYRDVDGEFEPGVRFEWFQDGWHPQAFADDGARIFVTGFGDSDFRQLRKLDVETGELIEKVSTKDDASVLRTIIDRDGRLVGITYEGDYLRDVYLDPELSKLQRSANKALAGKANYILATSTDRRRVLIESVSDTDPGLILLWDRDARTMDAIGARLPEIDPAAMAPTRSLRFEARDGTSIPAYLTLPRGASEEKLPVVILPHGGPWARDYLTFDYLTQFIASRGYAVMRPNFRGSTGFGRAFREAGWREWGGRMQDDLADAARYLIDEGIADAKRIGIVGASYGGFAAVMGAIKTPELYACAVSINGVLNLPSLVSDDRRYVGGSYWIRQIGLQDEGLRAVSPYHNAEAIEAPVLIVQALDDPRVHAFQGQSMAQRLRSLDKDVEYVELERGGHGLRHGAARRTTLLALESFLAQHLAR